MALCGQLTCPQDSTQIIYVPGASQVKYGVSAVFQIEMSMHAEL